MAFMIWVRKPDAWVGTETDFRVPRPVDLSGRRYRLDANARINRRGRKEYGTALVAHVVVVSAIVRTKCAKATNSGQLLYSLSEPWCEAVEKWQKWSRRGLNTGPSVNSNECKTDALPLRHDPCMRYSPSSIS